MTNRDIAAAFDEIADLLEFQNANPFRVRAYRNAARRIGDLPEPLADIVADPERDLTEIEGIGKDLAEKIAELVDDRQAARCSKSCGPQMPAGVLALLRIPGLGPKKAAALHKELGIASLDMLRAACEADQVSKLKGFGEKTQDKILAGIDFAAQADERMYWAEADEIVQELLGPHAEAQGHPADGSGRQLPPRPGNDRRPRPAGRRQRRRRRDGPPRRSSRKWPT